MQLSGIIIVLFTVRKESLEKDFFFLSGIGTWIISF
jgi:hypothetical protein